MLVVDQLEELFTLTAKTEDRTRFDAMLAEALRDLDGPLHLVTTVRSDFLVRFAELPELQGLLNNAAGRYLLPPISEAGLKDVVRTPARLAGLRWSEDSLPDYIVSEAVAESGALPLVGNLLRLLWDERDGHMLSARVYRELGGPGGALARRADLLLASLDSDVRNGRDRARRLLLELVEPGHGSQDSRRTITREMALGAAGGGREAEIVLDRLSGLRGPATPRGARSMPRLVTVSGAEDKAENGNPALVDLAHEALLRDDRRGKPHWKTLRDWVDQYRKQLEDRRLLEILAEKWQAGGASRWSDVLARPPASGLPPRRRRDQRWRRRLPPCQPAFAVAAFRGARRAPRVGGACGLWIVVDRRSRSSGRLFLDGREGWVGQQNRTEDDRAAGRHVHDGLDRARATMGDRSRHAARVGKHRGAAA